MKQTKDWALKTNYLTIYCAGFQQGAGRDLPHPERLCHSRPRASPAIDPREQGFPAAALPDVFRQIQCAQLHQEPSKICEVRCDCCGKAA